MKATRLTTTTSAILASAFLLTETTVAAPGDTLFGTEFNTPGDLEGWTDNGNRLVGFDGTGQEDVITNGDGDGVFAAQISGNDPMLQQTGLSIDHSLTGKVVARLRKSDGAGGWLPTANVNADLVLFSGPGSGGNQTGPDSKVADETSPGDGWTLVEWDLTSLVTGTITGIRWDPINSAIGDSFELDYFRIIEVDAANTPVTVEYDPGTAIPAEFNLMQQWDTAAELAALSSANLSPTLGGSPGVNIGPCTIDANEDCVLGFSINNADSQLVSPGGLAIPVAADDQMIIEFGVVTDSTTGTTITEMFWSDASGGFAAVRRLQFTALPADDALHIIRVTFRNGKIVTQLNQLRYDPVIGQVGIQAELDYIRIYTDSPPAPVYNWDSDSGTAGAQGGTGTWDTTGDVFYDSANMVQTTWPATPTGDDDAIFGATAGTVTIDAGGITAHGLNFETDGYLIGGGDLTLDGSVSAPFIDVADTLSAEISANIAGDDDNARKTGLGTLTLSGVTTVNSLTAAGGTLTIPSGALVETLGANPGENNYAFKLTGASTLNIDGTIDASSGDFGGFSGDAGVTVNLNSGGDLTTKNAIVGWNAPATYNFNGGTSFIDGQFRHQDGGIATINISAGNHEVTGLMGANNNGNGSTTTITISGGTTTAGSVGWNVGSTVGAPLGTNTMNLNLDGGVLETDRVFLNRGPATSPGDNTFNLSLNGGTLRASTGGASSALIDGNLGSGLGPVAFNVTLGANGATIDTNGQNKSIGPDVLGTSSGDLTKTGAGNLYLDGLCDYDGATLVTAGKLGGSGSTFAPVTFSPGTGLARRITDPANPGNGLLIEGQLTVPDPLVIAVDSAGTSPFPETAATGIVVVEATNGITGFNPATVTIDTSDFTGAGAWTARLDTTGDDAIVLDYVPATTPFEDFMEAAFPGETDPLIVGPAADPDKDGVTNIEEFGFAGNPDDATDNGPGNSGINDVGGTDYLTITVAVRTDATFSGTDAQTATVDGVVYTIDGTADLETFDSVVTEVTPALTAGLPAAPAGYEYRSFRLNPGTSAGLGFLRAGAVEEVE